MKTNSALFSSVKEDNNFTTTENGRLANKSTLNACLDFFGQAASCRNNPAMAVHLFREAFREDKLIALKALFYMRDIRGNGVGMGERNIFRACLKELSLLDRVTTIKLLPLIPVYGRWDDLFGFDNNGESVFLHGDPEVRVAIADIISAQLSQDLDAVNKQKYEKVSLLAKWLPSCNTSSKRTVNLSRELRKLILPKDSEKTYRQICSLLRKVIDVLERRLSNKDYTFDYSKLPGKAALKYRAAFTRHDAERYNEYHRKLREALENGTKEVKFNAGTLYPYEILERTDCRLTRYLSRYGAKDTNLMSSLEATNVWNSLPDYFSEEAKSKNWLVVGDTSESMTSDNGRPMAVACSLSMYTAAHNNGIFKDKFILFSSEPKFIELDSSWPLDQQVAAYMRPGFVSSNTDLDKVFRLILHTAVKHNLPESEMPEAIIIVSDMQFDYCTSNTRQIDFIKSKYAQAGYKMPKIVFWNVASTYKGNVPITANDKGVMLVNGCKPGMFEFVLSGTDPVGFMLQVLNHQRYSAIVL